MYYCHFHFLTYAYFFSAYTPNIKYGLLLMLYVSYFDVLLHVDYVITKRNIHEAQNKISMKASLRSFKNYFNTQNSMIDHRWRAAWRKGQPL